MSELTLVTPTAEHIDAIRDYRQECVASGERTHGDMGLLRFECALEWIEWCRLLMNESSNPEGVSFEQYMLIRYDEKRILGMISFKNYPDGDNYGHIGYTVRPSERNHGYAKGMLRLCLDAKRADRKFTLGKVLITCEKSNLASRSVILSCGGVYEGDMETRGGITLERYWIFL